MPQTIEAIHHAKAAGAPIIVAVNKIDKPDANSTRVINELLQHEVVVESLGGETQIVEVSATKKIGLDKLIDAIRKTEVVSASRPDAFFFFNRVNGGLDSKQLKELLLRSNVLLRDCGSFGRPFEKFSRFAIKTHDRNVHLVEAFQRTAEIMDQLKTKGE